MRKLTADPSLGETAGGFTLLEGSIRVRADEFPEVAPAEMGRARRR